MLIRKIDNTDETKGWSGDKNIANMQNHIPIFDIKDYTVEL